jgi:ferredoxin
MSIPTSRTGAENARIFIDHSKCTLCGQCVKVCKDFSLVIREHKLSVSDAPLFGCIGCGQCVAVCPHDAILVEGRTLNPGDYSPISRDNLPDYDQLHRLALNRRSIRDFRDKPVEQEKIDRILAMAATAPMGIPPSDVGVLVINGKEKVRQFSFDFIGLLGRMQWMLSPVSLSCMRPFMKKDDFQMFKAFVVPLVSFFTGAKMRGENYLLYDAPLAVMFYGNMSDPADPYIAATYATLAAESMGLGSCMIGSVGPFLKSTGKKFRAKYRLPERMHDSIIVIFGYPQMKYHKTIKRSFAKVDYC